MSCYPTKLSIIILTNTVQNILKVLLLKYFSIENYFCNEQFCFSSTIVYKYIFSIWFFVGFHRNKFYLSDLVIRVFLLKNANYNTIIIVNLRKTRGLTVLPPSYQRAQLYNLNRVAMNEVCVCVWYSRWWALSWRGCVGGCPWPPYRPSAPETSRGRTPLGGDTRWTQGSNK